jgi:hypothetical protein
MAQKNVGWVSCRSPALGGVGEGGEEARILTLNVQFSSFYSLHPFGMETASYHLFLRLDGRQLFLLTKLRRYNHYCLLIPCAVRCS